MAAKAKGQKIHGYATVVAQGSRDFYNAYSPDWTKYIMVDGTRVVNQSSLSEAIATWEKSKAEVSQ